MIFDSCVQGSIKGTKRSRRTGRGSRIIHLAGIKDETPVPKQMETFWKSSGHKVIIQSFAKKKLADLATLNVYQLYYTWWSSH